MNEENKSILKNTLILNAIAIVDYYYTGSIKNALLFGLFYYFITDFLIVKEEEKENPGQFDSEVEKVGYVKFYFIYLLLAVIITSLQLLPITFLLGLLEYFK